MQHPHPSRGAELVGLTVLAVCLIAPQPCHAETASETAVACPTPDTTTGPHLRVLVSGARRAAGNITFTLYGDDPARFLAHGGSIALTRVTLRGPAAEACFAVSRPGTYAVAVYHDENDNHRFDRNFLGLPAEGYGFSNNAGILLGPPSFSRVRFAVQTGDNRIGIQLTY